VGTAGCVWLFPVRNHIWGMLLILSFWFVSFPPCGTESGNEFRGPSFLCDCHVSHCYVDAVPVYQIRVHVLEPGFFHQYFLALLPHMCLRRFPLALRLTFPLPNQRCHGLLLNVKTVGSGWFWIFPSGFLLLYP